MSTWGGLMQEKIDSLKEMAARGLISGHTLFAQMDEIRNEEKLETLRRMFEGGNLGESIFVDVLGANKGSMKESIEVLLEMTEQQQKLEREMKEEAEILARFQAEAEMKRKKEEEERINNQKEEEERIKKEKEEEQQILLQRAYMDAENTFVKQQMEEFVHIHQSPETERHQVKLVEFEDLASNNSEQQQQQQQQQKLDLPNKRVFDAQTQTSPSVSPKYPKTPPPTYDDAIKKVPFMGGAGGAAVPVLPAPSAPPMNEAPDLMDFAGYSDESFFFSSWIPSASYLPSLVKRVVGGDNAQDILSASVMGTQAKGLKNGLGENNCFLNVVIQSLFHLKAFRTKFNEHPDHSHTGQITEQNCPYCALKLIFAQYQYGEDNALPPTSLRQAMSVLGSVQKRFQMGALDDAAEAHDTLLSAIHSCVCNGDETKDSFVHDVFAMKVVEYMKCDCGKPQKPFPCKQFIFYVSSKALRQQAIQHLEVTDKGVRHTISFGEAIRKVNEDDPRQCANEKCTKKNPLRYALVNQPDVLTVGIVWNTASPPADYISEIMELVDKQLKVEEMFDSVVKKGTYTLRGMISYYGLHYNAYLRNPKTEEWLAFDDARVTKVGSWQDVIHKCSTGRWQPFVLWYELNNQ